MMKKISLISVVVMFSAMIFAASCAQAAEGRKAGERMLRTVNGVEYAFRWCPAGTFMMGSPASEEKRDSDETQHSVTLSQGFWMLETEVTVGMYRSFESDSGYRSQGVTPYGWTDSQWKQDEKYSWKNPGFSQEETHPVTCVSWNDAAAFCKWLERKLGMRVQLPTEAQWEYACRAGTTEAYHFGTSLNGDRANCNGKYPYGTEINGAHLEKTAPVGSYPANAWGLYDMHGNVWEWCSDWYGTYPSGAVTDPVGTDRGSLRVNRGGCWNDAARYSRSAIRRCGSLKYRLSALGFRVSLMLGTDAVPSEEPSEKPSEKKISDTPVKKPQIKEPVSGEADSKADNKSGIKPGRKAGERMVRTVNGVEYAFRWCPAGTFMMGSPDTEGAELKAELNKLLKDYGGYNETQHSVTLSQGFWLLETEVTQEMWENVMGDNPSNFKGKDLPVERVSWDDCQAFCQKLRSQGMNVQLPTEAQWEYACRAGTTAAYAGDLDAMGWCGENSSRTTHAVGQKNTNAWGLYDMHGNVWEWCSDYWKGDLGSGAQTDPTGPDSGSLRVNRGGCWTHDAESCRSACRDIRAPGQRNRDLGFRVSIIP